MIETPLSPSRRPKFGRSQIIRLGRLLNMRYTPAEIAHEIGVTVDTVYRSYIPAGCPAEQDLDGRIWIVGTEFRQWVRLTKRRKQKHPEFSKPGVGWCFHCSKPVRIMQASIQPVNYYLELLQGECEFCGNIVNRAQATHEKQGNPS